MSTNLCACVFQVSPICIFFVLWSLVDFDCTHLEGHARCSCDQKGYQRWPPCLAQPHAVSGVNDYPTKDLDTSMLLCWLRRGIVPWFWAGFEGVSSPAFEHICCWASDLWWRLFVVGSQQKQFRLIVVIVSSLGPQGGARPWFWFVLGPATGPGPPKSTLLGLVYVPINMITWGPGLFTLGFQSILYGNMIIV